MFNMVDIGERAGSGIPNIFNVWKKQGWSAPEISETIEPERITISLDIGKPTIKTDNKKQAIKTSDKKQAIKTSDKYKTAKTTLYRETVISYLTDNVTAKTADISALLGISMPRTRVVLSEMIDDGIIIAEGANRNRVYKLKS